MIYRHSISRFVALLLLMAMTVHFAFAQSEWENISSSYFRWGINSQLNVSSRTLSNLTMWNPNAETREDKKNNKWTSQDISMNINWTETRPWKISFSIWNGNNRHDYKYRVYDENNKERWHTGNIYWGFKITVKKSYGNETFTQYFANTKNYNSHYTYTRGFNSDRNSWADVYDFSQRNMIISYDGNNTITLSDTEGHTFHTFYGAKSLSSITICAGPAADVHVTNFTAQRRSAYAEVKPFITTGDSKYNNKDYWGAIEAYSKAIENGHKTYDIYYKRASAYYVLEFYSNAIDDYTSAISYKGTEDAYLYRGLAKLNKKDISGIEDLKRGGTRGQALVREFEVDGGASSGNSAQNSKYKASGTGFFIDTRGYIATNYHVIDGAKGIDVLVTNNGKTSTYSAKSVVSDKSNDLAILMINDSGFSRLSPIPYTISAGTKDVGTKVFAMGYPELSYLGEEIKVTDGIISSKTGYQGDITTYQISAPIQHGNSGGPLFDNNGNVVGVTNAGVQELQNVGYAIKVSYLNNLIEASPEVIYLPTTNQTSSLSFTEKVKRISPYVVIIKIY